MPAGKLAEHFDPEMGRPTKELYSMAGLLFIMEFRNWTHEEAADAYMFNIDAQYALNLQPERQSLCCSEEISLVSPTSGKCPAEHIDPGAITVSDFRIEDGEAKDDYGRTIIVPTRVERPGGQKPHRSFDDDFLKQINILQHPHVRVACPLLQKCPVRFALGWNQVTIEEKQVRLGGRSGSLIRLLRAIRSQQTFADFLGT